MDTCAAIRRRSVASDPSAATLQRLTARMDLFMLMTVLFEYLERVDGRILDLAKEVSPMFVVSAVGVGAHPQNIALIS